MATAWMPEVEQRRSSCRIAALAKQYMDVLSEQPGAGEKRRGEPGFDARCVEAHLAPASARTRMCGPGSAPGMAACHAHDANQTTASGARPFWLLFGALRRRSGANSAAGRVAAEGRMPAVMPKSNPLANGERKLFVS